MIEKCKAAPIKLMLVVWQLDKCHDNAASIAHIL
jgi:hypothetical protein